MKIYDPQMHTAEHVLNQVMIRQFGTNRCVTMHLEKKKSKCDFVFDRMLSTQDELVIESLVNDVLKQGLPVDDLIVTREEAEKLVSLAKLPDESGDTVRLIKVGDFDTCACIGNHVANTLEVGEFKIISTSFEEGILRIRFKLNRPA
jgi:misacylated tRNA(Ala) deacylase